MQLTNINTSKLFPLTISSALLTSAFSLSYAALDRSVVNSVITSPAINNFMQQTNQNIYSQFSIKSQFIYRVAAWKQNTKFMSFTDQIVSDINFKAIVSMGFNAVPYIIDEIEREPSMLVWSLNFIFNKTISDKPSTTIEEACKLWVKSMR